MRIATPTALLTLAVATSSVVIFAISHTTATTQTAVQNNAVTNTIATPTLVTIRTATKTPSTHLVVNKPAPSASHTYVGSSVNFEWGTAQVTIVVRGNTVTDLTAVTPHERARSAYINDIAVPMLRREVLQARTPSQIKKIYGISGATMTSIAFYDSLMAALRGANLA